MEIIISILLLCLVLAYPAAKDWLITLACGAVALGLIVLVGGVVLIGLAWIVLHL